MEEENKCKNCNGKGYVKNYFVRESEKGRIPEYSKCPSCSQKSSSTSKEEGK